MKRDADFFGDQEMALVYIARRLDEALKLEEMLTRAEFDYAVEADRYRGGVVFQSERIGAFFYVQPDNEGSVREYLAANGYRPWEPLS